MRVFFSSSTGADVNAVAEGSTPFLDRCWGYGCADDYLSLLALLRAPQLDVSQPLAETQGGRLANTKPFLLRSFAR